jgi:hypothetical protein
MQEKDKASKIGFRMNLAFQKTTRVPPLLPLKHFYNFMNTLRKMPTADFDSHTTLVDNSH